MRDRQVSKLGIPQHHSLLSVEEMVMMHRRGLSTLVIAKHAGLTHRYVAGQIRDNFERINALECKNQTGIGSM
jgi:predicted metal-dependent TIM-barrel fold hydrolase